MNPITVQALSDLTTTAARYAEGTATRADLTRAEMRAAVAGAPFDAIDAAIRGEGPRKENTP